MSDKIDLKPLLNQIKNHPWTQQGIQLIHDTHVEVLIGFGSIFIASMTYLGIENAKNPPKTELAFSEIEKTERAYRNKGQPVPVETELFSKTNDCSMKVLEARNESYQWRSPFTTDEKAFGMEIEKKIERTMRYNAMATEYTDQLPNLAKKTLKKLKKMTDAREDLIALEEKLGKVWSYSTEDIYVRPEIMVYDSTTGKYKKELGERVYNRTIHDFDINKKLAHEVVSDLYEYKRENPDMQIPINLVRVTMTGADNEYAMYKSRREKNGSKSPDPEEYVKLANIWNDASNLRVFTPVVQREHNYVMSSAEVWDRQSKTSQDTLYETTSRTDDGPQGYQTIENIKGHVKTMHAAIDKIVGGIEYTRDNAPILGKAMINLVDVTQNFKDGDPVALANQVETIAENMYTRNFTGGLDVSPNPWLAIIGKSLLLGLGGAAAGMGISLYNDHRRQKKNRPGF